MRGCFRGSINYFSGQLERCQDKRKPNFYPNSPSWRNYNRCRLSLRGHIQNPTAPYVEYILHVEFLLVNRLRMSFLVRRLLPVEAVFRKRILTIVRYMLYRTRTAEMCNIYQECRGMPCRDGGTKNSRSQV